MDIFSDIQGHENVKRGLCHAFQTGRLHHALLMTGPSGIGKAMLARALAQAVLCEQTQGTTLCRCQTCRNCHRIAQNIHPDFLEIDEPTASIKIDTIRDLQKRLIYPPFESERRFVLIHDVHKMQDAAANCLLKTLEEPEAHTTFLLITSQMQKLLPTIVSRCQVIRFAPFTMEEVLHFLEKQGIASDMAAQIAALSNGSFGAALELSQGDYKTELTQTFEEMLEPQSVLDAFSIAAGLKGKKSMAEHLLSLLTMFVRDLLVLRTEPDHPIFLRHYRSRMEKILSRTTDQNLQRAASVIQEVNEAFQGNANEQMAWERLMLGMHGVLF